MRLLPLSKLLVLLPDRRRLVLDIEEAGDMIKSLGEKQPVVLRALFSSMIEFRLEKADRGWKGDASASGKLESEAVCAAVCRTLADKIDDRLLSLRFSCWSSSRMASSIELVIDKRSAEASSWAMLPAKIPEHTFASGVGWRRGSFPCEEVVRTMTGCCGGAGGDFGNVGRTSAGNDTAA